jgi:hypothetical protein
MLQKKYHSLRLSRGFTLVELLIYMVILTLVIFQFWFGYNYIQNKNNNYIYKKNSNYELSKITFLLNKSIAQGGYIEAVNANSEFNRFCYSYPIDGITNYLVFNKDLKDTSRTSYEVYISDNVSLQDDDIKFCDFELFKFPSNYFKFITNVSCASNSKIISPLLLNGLSVVTEHPKGNSFLLQCDQALE